MNRRALIDGALDEYLGTLYADPEGVIPLSTFVAMFQGWLAPPERRLWPRATVKVELGDRLATRRINGRDVEVVVGYSREDRVAQAAEAQRLQAEKEEQDRLAEEERKRERSKREAEAQQKADEEAKTLAELKAKRAAAHALFNQIEFYTIAPFVEYAPGSRIALQEIADKFNEAWPVEKRSPDAWHNCRPVTADDVRTVLLPTAHATYLDGDWFTDYRWCPLMFRPDGRLKRTWNEGLEDLHYKAEYERIQSDYRQRPRSPGIPHD